MLRWAILLVALVSAALVGGRFWFRIESERACYHTIKCQDRLHSLETQLEFYSSDKLLALEKAQKRRSTRRAFYPADLAELSRVEKGSTEFLACPVYGVSYVYEARDDGRSFFAYCPARHRFHFDGRPFVNAVTPEAVNLHLYVDGGAVVNLVAAHANPWDFLSAGPAEGAAGSASAVPEQPTREAMPGLSPHDFTMLATNPPAVTRW